MSEHATDEAIAYLGAVDVRIAQTPRGALTLDPTRSFATSLTDLVSKLASGGQSPYLAATASAVAGAQLHSFPENLFWDFDFYLTSVHARASTAPDYASYLEQVTRMTVDVMRLYGNQSPIQFRYVHDFMYGFDWARWVRRDPEARSRVEPFGLDFLQRLESRGRAILTLIEADDEWYPRLAEGTSRNPFPFSREPEDELRLYRVLAERGWMPVEAWRSEARPDAARDYDSLREDAARSLGLGR
jgi:hypothetical protein